MDSLIGNIIQNAAQHAKKEINANIYWDLEFIKLNIVDDGNGFEQEVLDNIGKPYISFNNSSGMGLGIFITKNLVENIGGKVYFKNNVNSNGSNIEIQIKRKYLENEQ